MRRALAALVLLVMSTVTVAAQSGPPSAPDLLDQTDPGTGPASHSLSSQGLDLSFGQPVGQRGGPASRSPVVTVDQDRLFEESAWGRRVVAEVERRSAALAAENRAIEEDLVAEEQELTDLRPEMEPDAFRARATDFDERVQRLRSEQDAKAVALAEFREAEQQRFFAAVGDVLTEVVTERGAVAVLDRRAIILSIESIDITDEVIARVDTTLGDGASGVGAAVGGPRDGGSPETDPAPGAAGSADDRGAATGLPVDNGAVITGDPPESDAATAGGPSDPGDATSQSDASAP